MEDWGSACGSAVDAGVSGAGVDAGAGVEPGTEAAAGRRRAALGANFLPVVFLLMKELNVAAALGAGALSLPAAAADSWLGPWSADMVVLGRAG